MPYFTTDDGVRIHYRVAGTGSPTLLFVHGWCSNLRHWDLQARYFSRRYRVVRVDRRGHGRSSVPEDGYNWPRHAEDIAGVARSLGVRDAIVIGHAGGVGTVLQLAHGHPWLVRALVLDDAAPSPMPGIPRAERSPLIDALSGPDYVEQFKANYRRYFSDATDPRLVEQCVNEAARTPQKVAVAELRSIFSTNTAEYASQLTMPVLYIGAGHARVQVTAPLLRQVIPHAQFAQVVDSEHFVHVDVPDQFNAMLKRFIERL